MISKSERNEAVYQLTDGNNIKDLSLDQLYWLMTVTQYATQQCHNEIERRGEPERSQRMAADLITANEMADAVGVDRKAFRQALRNQRFSWHSHDEPWLVRTGSPEHEAMLRALRINAAVMPRGKTRPG